MHKKSLKKEYQRRLQARLAEVRHMRDRLVTLANDITTSSAHQVDHLLQDRDVTKLQTGFASVGVSLDEAYLKLWTACGSLLGDQGDQLSSDDDDTVGPKSADYISDYTAVSSRLSMDCSDMSHFSPMRSSTSIGTVVRADASTIKSSPHVTTTSLGSVAPMPSEVELKKEPVLQALPVKANSSVIPVPAEVVEPIGVPVLQACSPKTISLPAVTPIPSESNATVADIKSEYGGPLVSSEPVLPMSSHYESPGQMFYSAADILVPKPPVPVETWPVEPSANIEPTSTGCTDGSADHQYGADQCNSVTGEEDTITNDLTACLVNDVGKASPQRSVQLSFKSESDSFKSALTASGNEASPQQDSFASALSSMEDECSVISIRTHEALKKPATDVQDSTGSVSGRKSVLASLFGKSSAHAQDQDKGVCNGLPKANAENELEQPESNGDRCSSVCENGKETVKCAEAVSKPQAWVEAESAETAVKAASSKGNPWLGLKQKSEGIAKARAKLKSNASSTVPRAKKDFPLPTTSRPLPLADTCVAPKALSPNVTGMQPTSWEHQQLKPPNSSSNSSTSLPPSRQPPQPSLSSSGPEDQSSVARSTQSSSSPKDNKPVLLAGNNRPPKIMVKKKSATSKSSPSSHWKVEKVESQLTEPADCPRSDTISVVKSFRQSSTLKGENNVTCSQKVMAGCNNHVDTEPKHSSSEVKPCIKPLSFTRNAYISVVVNCASSPSLFWVRPSGTELDQMNAKLNDCISSQKPGDKHYQLAGPAKIGMMVSAPYSLDQKFYRAKIVQVLKPITGCHHGNEFKADCMFVDYGNRDYIFVNKLKPLPEEFMELPMQAFPCSLSRVVSTHPHKMWNADVMKSFKDQIASGQQNVSLLVDHEPNWPVVISDIYLSPADSAGTGAHLSMSVSEGLLEAKIGRPASTDEIIELISGCIEVLLTEKGYVSISSMDGGDMFRQQCPLMTDGKDSGTQEQEFNGENCQTTTVPKSSVGTVIRSEKKAETRTVPPPHEPINKPPLLEEKTPSFDGTDLLCDDVDEMLEQHLQEEQEPQSSQQKHRPRRPEQEMYVPPYRLESSKNSASDLPQVNKVSTNPTEARQGQEAPTGPTKARQGQEAPTKPTEAEVASESRPEIKITYAQRRQKLEELGLPTRLPTITDHGDDSSIDNILPVQRVEVPIEDGLPFMLAYVESPDLFWVHLINETSAVLDDMMAELSLYAKYMSNPPSHKGTFYTGQAVLVKYSGDGCLYRGRVLGVFNASSGATVLEVHYVDYGNIERLPSDKVRPLPERLSTIPMLAVPCKLTCVNRIKKNLPWGRAAIEAFKKLVDVEEKLTAYTLMMFEGCAVSPTMDQPLEVLVVCGEDAVLNKEFSEQGHAEFDLQKVAEECQRKQYSMRRDESDDEEDLNTYDPMTEDYLSIRNTYQVDIDDPGVAITGYSAKDEERICKFYNTKSGCYRGDRCPHEHVRMDASGRTTDKRLVFCRHDVEAVLPMPEANTFVAVIVSSIKAPDHFYIQFPFGTTPMAELLRADTASTGEDDHCRLTIPTEDMEELQHDLSIYASGTSMRDTDLVAYAAGELVIARWEQDDQWYRARVIETSNEDLNVKVFFLDYGNAEWVHEKDLKQMTAEFMQLPFQAVEAGLPISPKDGNEWSPEARKYFRQNVDGIVMPALIHYVSPSSRVTLELYNTSEDQDKDIVQLMLHKGYAKKLPLSPPSSKSSDTSQASASRKYLNFYPG